MTKSGIAFQTCALSPFLEELNATFSALLDLEDCFLKPQKDAIPFKDFHDHFKKLTVQVANFYEEDPLLTKIEAEVNSPNMIPFIPCGVETERLSTIEATASPSVNQVTPMKYLNLPPADVSNVQLIKYPAISSVPFSLVDDGPQLSNLIEQINNRKEIGVELFTFHNPKDAIPESLRLSAICISLRNCEYLIDLNEIPDGLSALADVFKNEKITKIFHNTSRTCHLLHQFGIDLIANVFCISTAALSLGLSSTLEELTTDVRHRLSNESWIKTNPNRISSLRLTKTKDTQLLVQNILDVKQQSYSSWAHRPISLLQMNIARQQVHYLLYLYDSLRLKLKEQSMLSDIFLISQHKASMDWSNYLYYIPCPNQFITCSIYQQPILNPSLYQHLLGLKKLGPPFLTDPVILSICMANPRTIEALEMAIQEAMASPEKIYAQKPPQLPLKLAHSILKFTTDKNFSGQKHLPAKRKTMDEIATDLGWIQANIKEKSPSSTPVRSPPHSLTNETTVSPQLVKSASGNIFSITESNLRSLRDPNQPTQVSIPIKGIPKTEAKIYQLANSVKIVQKCQGRPKAKSLTTKEDQIPEKKPEDVLHSLVHVGFIDEDQARQINKKLQVHKPPKVSKRPHSSDWTPNLMRKMGPFPKRPRS